MLSTPLFLFGVHRNGLTPLRTSACCVLFLPSVNMGGRFPTSSVMKDIRIASQPARVAHNSAFHFRGCKARCVLFLPSVSKGGRFPTSSVMKDIRIGSSYEGYSGAGAAMACYGLLGREVPSLPRNYATLCASRGLLLYPCAHPWFPVTLPSGTWMLVDDTYTYRARFS